MAFRSVWPLYVLNVFQSGLIGNLLSNGFAVFFAIGLFVRIEYTDRKVNNESSNQAAKTQ
jgi:hypothetical protein